MTKSGGSIKVMRSLFQEKESGAIPTSPLQLNLHIIKPEFASYLNKEWHSRLPEIPVSNIVRNTHFVCFGAEYNSNWYAVAIWSNPVAQNRFKNGKKILELRRLAICKNAPKNTATRLISIMIKVIKKKFPEIYKLISYQDTEVHQGIIYKASNWKAVNKTNFISWTTKKRQRNKDQAVGKKIRWEYNLGVNLSYKW